MTKVYHTNTFLKYFLDQRYPDGTQAHLVATVDTDDVDETFKLTNHIDHAWFTNSMVQPTKFAQRSTSVGDIVVTGEHKYVYEFCGQRELTEDDLKVVTFVEE